MSAALELATEFPYRMQDLVQATGASRETIRFYVKEGLLPEPHRTARNSAWYSDQHIETIRLIRELQEKHYLPLKAIRALMDDPNSSDFNAAQKHVFETVLQRSNLGGDTQRRSLHAVVDELGLDAAELKSFRDNALLLPDSNDGSLGADDEELLRLWATVRAAGLTAQRGFSPADVALVGDAADILFNQMVRSFTERLDGFSDTEAEALWETILPGIERVFGILLKRKVRRFVEQFSDSNSDSEGEIKA